MLSCGYFLGLLKNFIWNCISQHCIVAAYVGLCGYLVTVKKKVTVFYVIVVFCEPVQWSPNCFGNVWDHYVEIDGQWLPGPGCIVIDVVLLFLIHTVYRAGTDVV
jgi:hypothetical protein